MFFNRFKVCGFSLLFLCNSVFAAGVTTHLFMQDIAVENTRNLEFKQLLIRNQNILRNGAIFPDSGYIHNESFGELIHWDQFHNRYLVYLDQHCLWPLSSQCERLLAFFLGTLSHAISDVTFHRDFIPATASHDFNGNYSAAHSFSDKGIEMLANMDYGRQTIVPSLEVPFEEVLEIINSETKRYRKSEVVLSMGAMYGIFLAERAAAPLSYLYFKFKAPWAAAHYFDEKGGVKDSALAIANLWEQVWERLVHHQKFLGMGVFKVGGTNWPNVTFYLE